MSMKRHKGLSVYHTDNESSSAWAAGAMRISVVTALCQAGLMITGATAQLDSLLVMGIVGSWNNRGHSMVSIIRRYEGAIIGMSF